MTSLLTQLGCEVVGMNIEQTGIFAHPPEPIPAHLDDLCALPLPPPSTLNSPFRQGCCSAWGQSGYRC